MSQCPENSHHKGSAQNHGTPLPPIASRRGGSSRAFVELQHRYRGLIAEFRSRRFVEKRRLHPNLALRSALQDLLLDARAAIEPQSYRAYLEWMADLWNSQLRELIIAPVGVDELLGVYAKAPIVPLDHELLWITERLRIETPRINSLIGATALIQRSVFEGAYEAAVEQLTALQASLGVSLWSVQLRLALEQLAGGLERQKRYSAELRTAHRTGLLSFTTYHTSVRNEERTTLAKFYDDIDARIAALIAHSGPTKTYDRYRLKNQLPHTDLGLAEVLRVEQSHGIVDIYETYIAVIQEIVKHNPTEQRACLILRCIDQLSIEDFRLNKLVRLLAPDRNSSIARRETNLSAR